MGNKIITLHEFLKKEGHLDELKLLDSLSKTIKKTSSKDKDLNKTAFATSSLFWLATCFFMGCDANGGRLNLIFKIDIDGNPWTGNGSLSVKSTFDGEVNIYEGTILPNLTNRQINSLLYLANQEGYFGDDGEPPDEYWSDPNNKIEDNLKRDYTIANFKPKYYEIIFAVPDGEWEENKSVIFLDRTGSIMQDIGNLDDKELVRKVGGQGGLYPNNKWMTDSGVYIAPASAATGGIYRAGSDLPGRVGQIFDTDKLKVQSIDGMTFNSVFRKQN